MCPGSCKFSVLAISRNAEFVRDAAEVRSLNFPDIHILDAAHFVYIRRVRYDLNVVF